MKLVNLQFALFFSNKISRPDIFANRVNSRLDNLFDAIPQILNLPEEIPADIPVVQMHSSKENIQFNVCKQRCDLIVSPELLSQVSFSSSATSCQEHLFAYLKAIFEETTDIVRVGIIATAFKEQEEAATHVCEKYLNTPLTCKEASIRINRTDSIDGMTLNNITEVSDGNLINEKLGINQNGLIIRRDINNVPQNDVLLTSKQIKTIWKRALTYFNDKKLGELK